MQQTVAVVELCDLIQELDPGRPFGYVNVRSHYVPSVRRGADGGNRDHGRDARSLLRGVQSLVEV